tara:strand:- start:2316 stop:2843 length:528 start_codon:yes stop_codon:yes gene_type:complete
MENYKVETLIKNSDIDERISQLGQIISSSYSDTNKLIVVGLLRGSFMFIADLVRKLDVPVEVDFITVSSYGSGMTSSGNVKILKDLDGDISGHDVLIVEDIVDTGKTLEAVIEILETRMPNSIKICALLNKQSRRISNIKADWIGFEIPDEFVVGYGIDYDQRNRNLPFIGKVVK